MLSKIISSATQLLGFSLLLLGMSLLATNSGILTSMAGIFFIGIALLYAARYFSRLTQNRKEREDDYFF
jgi:hypothetical protein